MADEVKTFDFVVNDDSILNSYGFRIMTSGIDLTQYKRNPIVLYYHKRGQRWAESNNADDVALPIGKAIKLWKDGSQLKATIQFDSGADDKLADKIEGKVERGFINMCSLGADPITISEEKRHLLEGQTRPTVTKSRLDEISIVDIGGNDNAIRLSKGQDIDQVLPKINLSKNDNNMDFKMQVAAKLGLDSNAAENVILSALDNKITLAKDAGTYKTKFEDLEKLQNEADEKRIITLVNANVDKKFTADKKESMIALGKTLGAAAFENHLGIMANIDGKATDMIDRSSTPPAGGEKPDSEMTFAKLKEKGLAELEKFKADKPQEYIELFKAEYGFEPEMEDK